MYGHQSIYPAVIMCTQESSYYMWVPGQLRRATYCFCMKWRKAFNSYVSQIYISDNTSLFPATGSVPKNLRITHIKAASETHGTYISDNSTQKGRRNLSLHLGHAFYWKLTIHLT